VHSSIIQYVTRKFTNLLCYTKAISMFYRFNIAVPGKRTLWSALLLSIFLSLFSLNAHSQGDPYFYLIEAKAGAGGVINPTGSVYVLNNSNITFEIIPDPDRE